MKASFKVGPKAVVEAEGETVKQVFERVADMAEVFGADDKCGCCGSDKVVPRVRRPQNYVYYSLACQACQAELSFGQAREGERLYAKRDKGKNGWEVYQGGQSGYAAPAVARGRPAPQHGDNQEIPY